MISEFKNEIFSINGPVVKVKNTSDFSMMEMVYVGEKRIIGEVISINEQETTIQVYESTSGLKPKEPVIGVKTPLFVTLGPGIISNIYDGIQRPLRTMQNESGKFIKIGSHVEALSNETLYDVKINLKIGDNIKPGQIYATCQESALILHKCMLSPLLKEGVVTKVAPDGKYKISDTVMIYKTKSGEEIKLNLCQKWPIRLPRPIKNRLKLSTPLITGQRIIDTLFPIAKGGNAAIPGGFGTGKTMTQHALAKWSNADVIVYIGCGERGNEITQVLEEFSKLVDPKTGKKLTDRTILIANTSNMPVAAREASIYTGITLAEYYRDMGYDVAIMADSTSRWAEALREISGRLEEMPAEEGFPSYLPSRLAQFYERAGLVETLSDNCGSITIIGAVSPQGADFSEPVTQNTKRFVRCFWALDKNLAYARHYPAINWLNSYSEYCDDLKNFFANKISESFLNNRIRILSILNTEAKLMEIVKLIGSDVLPDDEKLTLAIAKTIRIGFLQQNAFNSIDAFVSLEKQNKMMELILYFYDKSKKLIDKNMPISVLLNSSVFNKLERVKFDISNNELEKFQIYFDEIDKFFEQQNVNF